MINYFKEFFDWSEAWATLIPLIIFIIKKPEQQYLKPIYIYLWIACVLYFIIDTIWKAKHFYPAEFKNQVPLFLWSNNFLYNIISILRMLSLLWFFDSLKFQPLRVKNFYVGIIAFIIIVVNFIFEPFNEFSSFTFSCESILLLIYSISYFLYLIKSDDLRTDFEPSLFIVTGIAIYEAANFFIFLFHKALTLEDSQFSVAIWKLSNVYFIILCLYFAKAFFGNRKNFV